MNGVVRTLYETVAALRARGHIVEVISPSDGYFTLPLPTYPDIRLAPFAKRDMQRRILDFAPEAIHIATEGPMGLAARALCLKWAMPFTTSYHTKFPEYIKARFPLIPLSWPYAYVRSFHNSGGQTMVTTPSMVKFLSQRGFTGLAPWARGVDLSLFHTGQRFNPADVYEGLPRPVFVNTTAKHAQNYNWESVSDEFFNLLTPEYEPNARRRWRRTRRMMRLASSPYHLVKRSLRKLGRSLKHKHQKER